MLYTLFWQREFAFGDVVKQVFAWQVLENDKVVFVILKQVYQLNYVLVLAHLENLYFSPLLIYLNRFHISFCDHFDRNLGSVALVCREFNNTELSLAQVFLNFVKVMNV